MTRRGDDLAPLTKRPGEPQHQSLEASLGTLSAPASPSPLQHMSQPSRSSSLTTGGKENLAVIVEAVSHAKEGILKDISRLLDEKLDGLDDVVVELIRCKSENDSLKQKLKTAIEENDHLRSELSKFKSVQFGFYRKVQ
jgi:hypothetical protein